jgi:hypothetical protein
MPCPSPIQPQDGLAQQQQQQHRQSLPPPQHQQKVQEGQYYPAPTYTEQRKRDLQTATMAMGGMPPLKGGYQAVTPIPALGRSAAPTDCPFCGRREMTKVSYEIGNFTQYAFPAPSLQYHSARGNSNMISTSGWAVGLCCCLCLGCIPYLMKSLKDVDHKCGNCGVLLATWHRSGITEPHLYA